jgi:two-component system, LytTR family, response regulator
MKIRALIIDDESLARSRLRLLAKADPLLDIVGDCETARDGLAAIERLRPDLIFLDVQMPEMDGFQLLEKLDAAQLPLVIFTTAFDQHAVRAFEKHALDFLLKPIQPARFASALARARAQLANGSAARGLLEILEARKNAPAPRYLSRLTVKQDDRVVVVKTAEIDFIESAGNYVAINVGKESHILRETLSALETQLDPDKFLRVSRAAIVNLDRVKEMQPMFKGEHIIILQSGKQLTMSRALLRDIEHALKFR